MASASSAMAVRRAHSMRSSKPTAQTSKASEATTPTPTSQGR